MAKAASRQRTPSTVQKLRGEIEKLEQKNEHLAREFSGQLNAISLTQAVIEFDLDGTIVAANENFLNAMGYSIEELRGKHHSIFVTPEYRDSAEYRTFWARLAIGESFQGEYKRVGKNGNDVWIQGSYNPILGEDGKPFKVIKFATDVTATKMRNANFEAQIDAIRKSQAVVEFEMDGTIIDANQIFST